MSYPASTIPAFTAALKAALETQLGSGVTVCDGPAPPGKEELAELVELLDVEGEQVVKTLNRTTQPRAEEMTLTVLITVIQATRGAQTTVNERCFEIFDALNQVLRTSPSLAANYAGPGRIYASRITSVKHTKRTTPTNSHREAGLEVGVQWEARI